MKTKISILIMLAVFILVTPALAKEHEPIGDRISLYWESPYYFPAETAFNIQHGWYNPTNIPGLGLFRFGLEVDGEFIEDFFVLRSTVSGDPDYLVWFWVYNFPAGMTGTHTFTGHWYGPCQGLMDQDAYPGPCEKPNEIIEVTRSLIVIFE